MTEETELKAYTLSEIANHSDESSCWLVIHGKVYDVTSFLADHPGGEDTLLNQGGKESTDEFEDIGHSPSARDMLKQYEIGSCNEKDLKKAEKAELENNFPPIRENKTISTLLRALLPLFILAIAIFYGYYSINTKA